MTDRDAREALTADKRNKSLLVAGIDSSGHVRVVAIEEQRFQGPAGGYDGMVLATHEQVQQLMRSGFATLIGGRADADGTIPVADQAADGTAQRVLVDEMGRIWVRISPDDTTFVAERNLIIGEDARGVQLQALVVGKQTTRILTMALDLPISLLNTEYDELIPTQPMHVDRSRRQTFRVSYTPGVTGSEPWLYPQTTQGENPESWSFVQEIQSAATPVAGPVSPPTVSRDPLGYLAFRPFHLNGALTAATEYTETFMLGPGDSFPACTAVRWVVRDSSNVTAGAVTIIGTQE